MPKKPARRKPTVRPTDANHIFGEKKRKTSARKTTAWERTQKQTPPSKLPEPEEHILSIEADFDNGGGYILLTDASGVTYEVAIDRDSYQRQLDEDRAMHMAQHYDAALAGFIYFSDRDDGKLWAVSGQHRLVGAAMGGIPTIKALVWKGLTLDQESYLFNQEATQRVGISALDKFWSGVNSTFPDHIAVAAIVDKLGGKINRRLLGPSEQRGGINAVNELLKNYDFAGPDLLEEGLRLIGEGFGKIDGTTADGPMITAMTQFIGIYNEASPYGTFNESKLLKKLVATSPAAIKAKAKQYEVHMGMAPARFTALVDVYNAYTPERMKLEYTRPDWRKTGPKLCTTGDKRVAYRRGLCRSHYEKVKAQEEANKA